MNGWIYLKSESTPAIWTVGFYDPQGEWQPESDHDTAHDAAERVHYLNGGSKCAWDRRKAEAA